MFPRLNLAAKSLALLFATTALGSPVELLYRDILQRRDPPSMLDENASPDQKKWQPAMDL
jgi:hypothetical protein